MRPVVDVWGSPAREHGETSGPGMESLAQRVEAHHTAPVAGAEPLPYDPFSPSVMRWLFVGIAAGLVVGVLLGALMLGGVIVISGTEQLYSLSPRAFLFMWAAFGGALGVIAVGIPAIVAHRVPEHEMEE